MSATADIPEPSSAASRLCAACGMCCNGVMFHTVRMLPGDATKELISLGLKLKKKKKERYILQPCPAFKNEQCSIYLQRPQRCRLFECLQVKRVDKGEVSEAVALSKIAEAHQRVAQVTELLAHSGKTDPRRPWSKRFDKIWAEPVLPDSSEAAALTLRSELVEAMAGLEALLNADFRLEPLGSVVPPEPEE